MWSEKSFQDILMEKMNSQAEKKSSSSNQENTSDIRLNSRSQSTVRELNYWQISTPNFNSSPRIKPATAYPAKPANKPSIQWTQEQITIISEFIELGAELATDSPYKEIKRAYRRLLVKYHPDHYHGTDELALARNSRNLQKVIRRFKEFNLIKNEEQNKKGSAAAA